MKKIFKSKKIIFVLLVVFVTTAICLCGCGKSKQGFSVYDAEGELVFDSQNSEIIVEYGTTFNFPKQVQIDGKKTDLTSLELYDASGTSLKMAYGSYSFKEVGDYKVVYVAGGVNAEFKVLCRDTVAPEIKIVSAEYSCLTGTNLMLPKFTYSDASGVKTENVSIEVVSPMGKKSIASGEYLLLEEVGTYNVTIIVIDNNGIESRKSVEIEALPIYIDENKESSVLYSFDNEEYLGLVITFDGDATITRSIVQSGYPEIPQEKDGNKVLKVSSTKTFGNVYTRFLMNEDILASSGYRIVIRFALSTDTDFVKVFRNYKNLANSEIIGQQFGIEANKWYELEINPIDYGMYVNLRDFAFLYRDSGDTVLYIDEIYFTPYPFVDENIKDNTIADFDEDGYLNYVYDNIFKDPTTDHGKRVLGTEFSLVSAENAPAKNGANAVNPGLGASGKALKAVVTDKWMGINYFFPNKISVKETLTLTLRTFIEKRPNAIVVGFFDGSGYDLGKTIWFSTTLKVGEWFDWVFPSEALDVFTTTDEISGMYLQFTFADSAEMKNTIYIDEIFYSMQNEESEQNDITIASFDSALSLSNVGQNFTKATSEINWQNSDGESNGILCVKSKVSGDGFSYYFDEPLVLSQGSLVLNARIEKGSRIKRISVYAIEDCRSDVKIGDFSTSDFDSGEYVSLNILSREVLSFIPSGVLYGLRVEITTEAVSANNILYVDEICLFDVSVDKIAPTITDVKVTPINLLVDKYVDLSSLAVSITDNMDPKPWWNLVSIEDDDGNSVGTKEELEKYKFKPEKSGKYSLYIKAVDWANNESALQKVEIEVNLMESEQEWYLNALEFNSISDVSLVDYSYVKGEFTPSSIITDGERTVLSASLGAKAKGGYKSILAINLGGIYKAGEIGSVVFTLRVPEVVGSAGNTWYKAGANVSTTGSSTEISIPSGAVSTGVAKPTVTSGYITITITGEQLVTALGSEETVVKNIALWNTTSGGNEHPVTVYIDSVNINEKVIVEPITDYNEALQFNDEKSLQLVENSYVKGDFTAPSIITDGEKTVLSATLGAKTIGGYTSMLAISVGGEYKASEIGSVVITLRVPEIVNSAGNTWYKAGANVASGVTVTEISIPTTAVSNGVAKPTVTSGYITLTITGEQLVTAVGGDTVVTNMALWNTTSGGNEQPVTVYIDSIAINEKFDYAKALQFDDEKSLQIVEHSYVKGDFTAPSIITDGEKTVLSATLGAKAIGGYTSMLAICIGGEYKASEIGSVVITLRVPEIVNSAGNTWYKAGANVASGVTVTEISIPTTAVSNGVAKPTVTSGYITLTITGEQLATAVGGDTIVKNIALWNSTSSGEQPVTIYIDSIEIILNQN